MIPSVAAEQIHQRAKVAVERRGQMKPYPMTRPITLEVSMKNYRPVELLGYLSNVQRIDSHTIRFAGRDMIEVSKFLEFITSYESGLTP
jgi:D-amino peptidase